MGGAITGTKSHYFANSPAIGSIDRDRKDWVQQTASILEIEFVNGAVYRYFDVPVSVYRELMSAESKARFYDSNIKKHYRSALVRQRQKPEPPGNSRAAAQDSAAAVHE